jgi:uncharacterized protein YprB with RNaseH-like and TPR domain
VGRLGEEERGALGEWLASRFDGAGTTETAAGPVWRLDHPPVPLAWSPPLWDDIRAHLRSRLDLVSGVRALRAARLRQAGYRSLEELVAHPVYGEAARSLAELLEAGDPRQFDVLCRRRLGGEGWALIAGLVSRVAAERIVFLDLETLGLAVAPIVLAGVARVVGRPEGAAEVVVRQYLAADLDEEPALLEALLDELAEAELLVTYNGTTADLPWLRGRLAYFGLGRELPEAVHVDLYYGARRLVPTLRPCTLGAIEETLLGRRRVDDVPGALVPALYAAYLDDPARAGELLGPVVEHNRHDVRSLAELSVVVARRATGARG